MRRLLAAVALTLPFLAVPVSAQAPYTGDPLAKGVGRDMVPVAHIAYPNGTDLEFATIKGHDYAVAPSQGAKGGLRLINIDRPERPKVTGFLSCPVSQNDVQVRGSLVLLGIDGSASGDDDAPCFKQARADAAVGLMVISIANPAKPKAIGFVPIAHGVHNVTWHPGGRYAYVSDSELTPDTTQIPFAGRIQIVDLGNPRRPKHVSTYRLVGDRMSTHDITFNKKGTRAYVAALQETYILDTSSPAEPSEIARIEDPSINISHGADPTPDGKYLLVTDEQAGALANGVCNVGGVHVFDLTVEAVPVKVGFYFLDPANSITATTNSGNLTCTAHVLDYSADGKTWTNGNYAAGVRMMSAKSVLGRPTELAYFTPEDANTWSAKTYKSNKYVFANDLERGFDVYKWVPGKGTVDTRTPGAPIRFAKPAYPKGTYCFNVPR